MKTKYPCWIDGWNDADDPKMVEADDFEEAAETLAAYYEHNSAEYDHRHIKIHVKDGEQWKTVTVTCECVREYYATEATND